MMRDQHIGATTGNARVNSLTNSRFKLGEIARQVNRNLALFTIHRAEFHAQFYPLAIGFAAAVASHAAHVDNSAVISREVEKSCVLLFRHPERKRGTSPTCARHTSSFARQSAIVGSLTRKVLEVRDERARC